MIEVKKVGDSEWKEWTKPYPPSADIYEIRVPEDPAPKAIPKAEKTTAKSKKWK